MYIICIYIYIYIEREIHVLYWQLLPGQDVACLSLERLFELFGLDRVSLLKAEKGREREGGRRGEREREAEGGRGRERERESPTSARCRDAAFLARWTARVANSPSSPRRRRGRCCRRPSNVAQPRCPKPYILYP